MISSYLPISFVNAMPTINGERTYYWSQTQFQDIKRQFLVGGNSEKPALFYFIKEPSYLNDPSIEYHKHFRNQLRHAQKNNLYVEEYSSRPLDSVERTCYSIYAEHTKRLRSFSFPKEFFHNLCLLTNSSLVIVQHDGEIISFGLCIGNVLFIQASTALGKRLCANNLLYDTIYRICRESRFFVGVSKYSSGHFHFKLCSGATPLPASPIMPEFSWYLAAYVRPRSLLSYFALHFNHQLLYKHLLP